MVIKGQLIDNRYKIIRTIGEGGMANVYLAYDTILEREVAVKILRGDLADDEKFVRRFQREANAASSLKHPNIVEMYDVGEDDGKYFIVMEFINGKTLKSLVKKRGALTIDEVIDIMLQLTSAVACAHDSYIIHRDIKPQNVMILEDGRVKITDFGIAMALNSNELTQTNSVMGSVHYLPPEQANGSGSTIKSDIYSLGILMFELLTGKLPFKGENAVEIAIKQMKEPIPSVIDIDPRIPQSVENVILRACAKNPKNRYDSAAEMYEDIKTSLNPNRINEERLVYRYPEHEVEENTKVMSDLSKLTETREEKNEELIEEFEEEKKGKKINKVIIICSAIGAVLVTIIVLILLLTNSPKDLTVPKGLIGKDQELVEEKLKNAGFKITWEEDYSDKYEEGKVISVTPKENTKTKETTKIKVVVSKGHEGFKLEDYVGENVEVVKAKLEKKGIKVITTPKKIDKSDENKNIEENSVIEQSVGKDSYLTEGDVIELTYATLVDVYPDFTDGNYTKEKIEAFCEDHSLKCTFKEEETTEKEEGTILSQNRDAGVEVKEGVSLTIKVAKAKTYTVSFDVNSGTPKIESQTIKHGETAKEPATPKRDKCTFNGWYTDNTKYTFNKPVTSNVNLVANWTCNEAKEEEKKDAKEEKNNKEETKVENKETEKDTTNDSRENSKTDKQ